MIKDDVEKGDEFDEDDEGEKRRKEEEEVKKQKEKQAMLDNLYVLICMIIIMTGAVIIVVLKIQLFPDERIISFIPLPQQVRSVRCITKTNAPTILGELLVVSSFL